MPLDGECRIPIPIIDVEQKTCFLDYVARVFEWVFHDIFLEVYPMVSMSLSLLLATILTMITTYYYLIATIIRKKHDKLFTISIKTMVLSFYHH